MNKELNGDGIKSVALCPGFVDTPMTEFVREHVRAGGDDPARRTSPRPSASCCAPRRTASCPEIVFQRPGERAVTGPRKFRPRLVRSWQDRPPARGRRPGSSDVVDPSIPRQGHRRLAARAARAARARGRRAPAPARALRRRPARDLQAGARPRAGAAPLLQGDRARARQRGRGARRLHGQARRARRRVRAADRPRRRRRRSTRRSSSASCCTTSARSPCPTRSCSSPAR